MIALRKFQAGILLVILMLLFPVFCQGASLQFVEIQKDGRRGVTGLQGSWCVKVSPDGRHVYAVGFRAQSLGVFTRDQVSGRLSFIEALRDGVGKVIGLGGPCSIGITPDGRSVYVAGHWDDSVVVFSRDASSGRLTFVESQKDGTGGVDGLHIIQAVTVSADGRNVYTAGYRSNSVAAFQREEKTGGLSFVEVRRDKVNGVQGLQGASDVGVSPDGQHVYATGYLDGAVAVFLRDRGTGGLRFIEEKRDGFGGVEGLRGASSLTFSPDGRNVYVAGKGDHGVVVFKRDLATGGLIFQEVWQEGAGTSQGLQCPSSLAVSPNGKHVYVAAFAGHAVAAFDRDERTGKLSFLEVQREGVAGARGIQGPSSVAVSPDGKHLYVTGNWVQTIAVFRIKEPE